MMEDKAKADSTQSLALLGLTTAAFAHRISNVLGTIPIEIMLAKEHIDDKERLMSILDRIQADVETQLQFVSQLSKISRLPASSGPGPTSVNAVIRETIETDYGSFQEKAKSPKFRLDLDSRLPDALADEQLLSEVIRNLVDNAIKALQGSEKGVISIRSNRVNDKIIIDVVDNGPGVPQGMDDRIFQLFAPTPQRETSGGLGMGLWVSRQIVDSWGGTLILAKSSPAGSTFRIALPRWKRVSHANTVKRALVVDDEPNWRRVLSTLMEERGLIVDAAATSAEAARLIETHDYDLITLDMRLDDADLMDVSGLNIARLTRKRNPEALIVVLTGFSTVSGIRDAMRLGVDEFLDKASLGLGAPDEFGRIIDKVMLRRETELESIRQSQLNRLMYEVLSMISHELRTPLLTVQRNAEALEMGAYGSLMPQQVEAVNTIRSAAHRGAVLLNAHLDLNRIEEGTNKLAYHEYDLITLVREEIDAHRPEATRKGVAVRAVLPEVEAKVRIDVDRFRVALNPLMDNAIKFSPEHGEVVIKVRLTSDYVEVALSDQGPGIKPDEIDRLLNWQGVDGVGFTRRIRSSGLGLSVAKRMIELQGGRFWIEGDTKSGTTVAFRLPIRK